jgi:hypothetical protein
MARSDGYLEQINVGVRRTAETVPRPSRGLGHSTHSTNLTSNAKLHHSGLIDFQSTIAKESVVAHSRLLFMLDMLHVFVCTELLVRHFMSQ